MISRLYRFSMDKIKVEDFYSEVRERVNNQKSEDIENLKKLAHITCEYYCAGTGCQMIEPKLVKSSVNRSA